MECSKPEHHLSVGLFPGSWGVGKFWKWNGFIWERNRTDLFGNELEPIYLGNEIEPIYLGTK